MNVFLTGGNGGIGKVIKELLEAAGISVVAPSSEILDLKKEFTLPTDRFDGFIHCAGVNYLSPFSGIDYSSFEHLLHINTLSFIKLCSRLNINDSSNIIAIGSLYADATKEHRLQYSVSKHGLLGVVRTLALEMSGRKIKVNMVSPGFVDTPMTRKNNTTERIDYLNNNIPLGLVSSQSIAELCHWLVTKNTYITGQNIKVDGGYSLRGI
jgi:NAD(P)-dependent dehydrogenase (short-subunit alcohol dehydrogenase family)